MDRCNAVGTNPPQLVPVLGAFVEEDRDSRVDLDVGQPAESLTCLRLVVDREDDHIADHGMDDRDHVRAGVPRHRRQGREPGGGSQRTPVGAQRFRNSLRRILPEADFGIESMNSTTLTFL